MANDRMQFLELKGELDNAMLRLEDSIEVEDHAYFCELLDIDKDIADPYWKGEISLLLKHYYKSNAVIWCLRSLRSFSRSDPLVSGLYIAKLPGFLSCVILMPYATPSKPSMASNPLSKPVSGICSRSMDCDCMAVTTCRSMSSCTTRSPTITCPISSTAISK